MECGSPLPLMDVRDSLGNTTIARRKAFGLRTIISVCVAVIAPLNGFAAPKAPKSAPDDCCESQSGEISGSYSVCLSRDIDSLWETDSGKKIKFRDLTGRVCVISMFYSTCQGVCLTTKQDMQALEFSLSSEARKRVGFILVTLDPRQDTAQALRTYRREECLSPPDGPSCAAMNLPRASLPGCSELGPVGTIPGGLFIRVN